MKIPNRPAAGKKSVFTRETRFLWARLPWHQVTVNVPWNKDGKFQRVLLVLTRGTNQSVTIDLTHLTPAELAAFRESVLIATEVAEPIVQASYTEALEKADAGDDSDDRIYRGLPQVVIRKGALGQYDQSVLQRRENVFQRIGAQVLRGQLPAFLGGGVDESLQEDKEADDIPSTDGQPS